ncbi:MAG: energy transducer TonB, partial [Saprospiraceae bacterium]|nr:energy transducer TonB [Saprospiraceae bacterium]
MDIAVDGRTLFIFLIGIMILITGLIFFFRNRFHKKGEQDFVEKYRDASWSSPLKARNKYPDVDVFNLSGPLFNFGLAAALGLTLLAFSWTQRDAEIYIPDDALEMEDDIEIEPPRTAEPPPPPPPPPPPV